MPFGEAKDEIAQSDRIWNSSSVTALREQQETDFGWWSGSYKYEMSGEEGEWENHTTNSGRVRGNKLNEILNSSALQLFIDVDEVKRKERKEISNTEQLANGIIWQADRDAMRVPSGKPLQSSMSAMAVIRGGVVVSLLWYIDKDGKPKCAIRVYDPMFCQWIEEDDKLVWFCYRDRISKGFVERNYGKQKKAGFFAFLDLFGRKTPADKLWRYTFWNEEECKVACNGEWIPDAGVKYNLDHIPVSIRSCGGIPLLSSSEDTDTMQYSWQSYAVNTRAVYPLESKLLSIEASVAADNARNVAYGGYDSNLSNNQPPDLKVVGSGDKRRNKTLFLNKAQGQEFYGFVPKPNNAVTEAFYARIKSDEDIAAGLDPQTLNLLARSGNTSLASELRSAAEEAVAPFRQCIEESFIWLAEEGVSQFIEGDYEKVKVEGRDRKREKFYADSISKKDVEESHFDCHLVSNRAQDEALNLDMAIREVGAGLSSPQTAMVKRNLHQDPDKELDNIAQANALKMSMADPLYINNTMAEYYHEQGNVKMALYHLSQAALIIEMTTQKAAHLLNPMTVQPGGNGQEQAPLPEVLPQRVETGMVNQPIPGQGV